MVIEALSGGWVLGGGGVGAMRWVGYWPIPTGQRRAAVH